jgi:2-polyprenyl-6-methoxyphenol hydroxylase-like FAD-dependent oxidoreductase
MMGLLLSRYGLTDESLLCLDSKSGLLKAGQADGLQPRTLEVLKTLGLADEILTDGCQLWEVAFWNPAEVDSIIERTSIVLDITVPARFPHEVTIHQGRIERILEDDMRRYSKRGVQRSSRLLDVHLDENGDPEFPVIAHIEITTEEGETVQQTIRTKYLVGADGAHSAVRRAVGIDLEGDSSDHIWGVVDFVADTNFPDIRRRSAIHSSVGSVMIIPRERTVTGEYLTRLYVQVPGDVNPDNDTENGDNGDARSRRSRVSVDGIFKQAQAVLRPYYIRQKDGTELDWWAAYQIGQRVAKKFSSHDSKGVARIFIVGDGW